MQGVLLSVKRRCPEPGVVGGLLGAIEADEKTVGVCDTEGATVGVCDTQGVVDRMPGITKEKLIIQFHSGKSLGKNNNQE